MHLSVVGAGHVGLVTAVGMANLGHIITVVDRDERRIEALRAGHSPIYEPGLEDGIREHVSRLSFTTDPRPPDDCRFTFIAVGTPFGPDGPLSLGNVESVVGSLMGMTGPEHTIVVRSTLPMSGPGALAALRGDGVSAPAIVTNPEFMREGSALRDFARPGRIVTGWLAERDRAAADAVLSLYDGIDAPTLVADAQSVALIKLASNGFLALKVAYANELARLADSFGADALVVADGMGMDDRIGRAFLDAGPGFGGSCLPEQAIALSRLARATAVPAPVMDAVAVANDAHQRAIVARLGQLLGGDRPGGKPLAGRRIALLGLAFKANTDDVRESPSLAIATHLRELGASVVATDPRAGDAARELDPGIEVVDSPTDAASGADALLVVTEWPEYRSLDWARIAPRMRGTLVYDLRGIIDLKAVAGAGLRAVTLGRP